MKQKIPLLLSFVFIFCLLSTYAQENVWTIPATNIDFGDYDHDSIRYYQCKWKPDKLRVVMNKISATGGPGSVEWYVPNGIGYIAGTSGKIVDVFVNGEFQATLASGENLEVFLGKQNNDQDTIRMTNTEDGTSGITEVIWSDFIDGTTIITAGNTAAATALNTKNNTVDHAISALDFTMADEVNGAATIIDQITFQRNDVVDFVDFWRILDAELKNLTNGDVLPLYIHNNFIRTDMPAGYEIADGESANFELKIWIKSGISSDLVTRMQLEDGEFKLSVGISNIMCNPEGDLLKYDSDFDLTTASFTFFTEASKVSLIKRDPFIAANKKAFFALGVTDANNVVDSLLAASGKTTTLTISKVSGPGDITSVKGLTQTCKPDTAWVDFTDVIFSAQGSYVLQMEAAGDYSATATFSVDAAEALTPIIEWTDFTDTTSLPTTSTPANASKEIIFVGVARNIPDPPVLNLAVNQWLDNDPVESFGFIVNTVDAKGLILTQRLTVSGPNSPDSLQLQYRVIDDVSPIEWTDIGEIVVTQWDDYDPQFYGGISLPAETEGKDSLEIRYLNKSVNNRHGDPGKSGASIKVWDLAVYGVFSVDDVKPVLSAVTSGTVTIGDDISATSNEAGMIYLVPSGTTGDAAAIAAASVISGAATADAAVTLSTTGLAEGDYIVYTVDEADNVSDPSAAITVEEGTGIKNADSGILVLYPNPVSDILHIRGVELKELQVFDITGKVVVSTAMNSKSANVSHLEEGLYLIKATSREGEQMISRFIKN
jgi:hypothetical protein